ncbi:hypothetical protein Fmac_008245 [Flemingia macrophylla]|uniref:Uncharacterized protein n=1 Tax=Flemingia macrophylla TaxID=520843 RepID=A0ABD1MWU3_9FABA
MYRVRRGIDLGSWIPKQKCVELEQKWNDENWKEKSKTNANNRNSSDGSLHTGGSIPTSEHFKRLKISPDMTPTCWDLFQKTHKTAHGTRWVSSKAERIALPFVLLQLLSLLLDLLEAVLRDVLILM